MWNPKRVAATALVGVMVAWGCSPEDYPTEPRFEVPDEVVVPGHTFLYVVPEGVEVGAVTVAGSFQDPVWTNDTDTLNHTWQVTVDLQPGTYEYKYVFNGDGWASDMCNEATWGDPANNNVVDAGGQGCVEGGGNGVLEVTAAGPHTFRYVVPEGVPEITSLNVAGSFQDPVWNTENTPMAETWERRYDLDPGSYEYKFIFDGNWASDMCAESTYAAGGEADANGQGCVEGGTNAVLTIE